MGKSKTPTIVIIGGGLAGLTTALHLSKAGLRPILIEKTPYPHHKVCGEYVSNEVLPYLNFLGINPFEQKAKKISKLQLSDVNGKNISAKLPLGGFGISRFCLDNTLYNAIKNKVEIVFDRVQEVRFEKDVFSIETLQQKSFKADIIIGAYGKRSNLDTFLQRRFILKKSPWLAVKAHYEYEFPDDTVALHNFSGGYCGLSKTETNAVNACYLTTFNSFKKHGNIGDFQNQVLAKNPFLKDFFSNAKPLFEKPLTISQISFQHKNPVEEHIFMIGDSAGLIHPLCGNGMAMAIHSAKLISELLIDAIENGGINRIELEKDYTKQWKKAFQKRLTTGKFIQNMLMNPFTSKLGFYLVQNIPILLPELIKRTHGSREL